MNSIDPSQGGPRGLTSGELRLVTAKKLQSSNDFGHRCRRSDLRPPMKVDLTVVDPRGITEFSSLLTSLSRMPTIRMKKKRDESVKRACSRAVQSSFVVPDIRMTATS